MILSKVTKEQLLVEPLGLPPRRFMNPGEIDVIVALCNRVRARCVVEFGVNEGLTARDILTNVITVQSYLGVDVLPGYVPAREVQHQELPAVPARFVNGDKRFDLLLRARGSLDLTPGDLGPADFVFIDGDHGREGVIHDTYLARSIMRPGGTIVWHDYHNLGTVDVREVLHEFKNTGKNIYHVEGTWIAFEDI